mmetsp:Transcript_28177/g.61919  ORF Transcript_28177/g.61919 Transcript_28177/m.61919 type:complete len:132 (+) Transcript_28177:412-807(+)
MEKWKNPKSSGSDECTSPVGRRNAGLEVVIFALAAVAECVATGTTRGHSRTICAVLPITTTAPDQYRTRSTKIRATLAASTLLATRRACYFVTSRTQSDWGFSGPRLAIMIETYGDATLVTCERAPLANIA